jgi:hypothetical protein
MTITSISRIVLSAIPTIMVCVSLALGNSAMAQSATPSDARNGRCSNRTLSGNYGFTLEGVLVACRSEFVTANSAGGVRVFPLNGTSIGGVGVDVAAEFAS